MIQTTLAKIYSRHNRVYTIAEFCCMLHRHQAHMGKSENDADAKQKIGKLTIRTFAWVCAVGTAYGIDVIENLYAHFPGICPYCRCQVCNGEKVERMQPSTDKTHKSLAELAEMLAGIYPKNELSQSIKKLGEEISELWFAYYVNLIKFREELADVTARLLAIVFLLDAHHSFENELRARFSDGCPSCKHTECSCPPYLEPSATGTTIVTFET